jgi:signal transduction histidine kinase
MAALIIAIVPVAGLDGLGTLYILAALMLATLRPPWSLLVFAALMLVPTPVAQAAGQPQWASYFTLGVLLAAVPLAVVVGLVRAARQLEAARSALAQQAVIRERLRIDGELRQTVGAALEEITVQGDRAGALAGGDPPAAARELGALVGAARRTLAAARRMVTRYQRSPSAPSWRPQPRCWRRPGSRPAWRCRPRACPTTLIRPRGRRCGGTSLACCAATRPHPW